jgi:hypothetical protein
MTIDISYKKIGFKTISITGDQLGQKLFACFMDQETA